MKTNTSVSEVPWRTDPAGSEKREKVKFKIREIPIARAAWREEKISDHQVDIVLDEEDLLNPRLGQFAEPTGNGDDLCYLGFSARFFLCSEAHCRNAVDEFVSEYSRACQNSDEDPAEMYDAVFNLNDFYRKLPITESTFGHSFGYTTVEGYRQDPIRISVTRLEPEDLEHTVFARFKHLGKPIIVIEPDDDYSYPNQFYMEV